MRRTILGKRNGTAKYCLPPTDPSSASEVATGNSKTAEPGEFTIIVGNMVIVRAKLNSAMYVSAQKEREIKQRRVGNFKKMAPR